MKNYFEMIVGIDVCKLNFLEVFFKSLKDFKVESEHKNIIFKFLTDLLVRDKKISDNEIDNCFSYLNPNDEIEFYSYLMDVSLSTGYVYDQIEDFIIAGANPTISGILNLALSAEKEIFGLEETGIDSQQKTNISSNLLAYICKYRSALYYTSMQTIMCSTVRVLKKLKNTNKILLNDDALSKARVLLPKIYFQSLVEDTRLTKNSITKLIMDYIRKNPEIGLVSLLDLYMEKIETDDSVIIFDLVYENLNDIINNLTEKMAIGGTEKKRIESNIAKEKIKFLMMDYGASNKAINLILIKYVSLNDKEITYSNKRSNQIKSAIKKYIEENLGLILKTSAYMAYAGEEFSEDNICMLLKLKEFRDQLLCWLNDYGLQFKFEDQSADNVMIGITMNVMCALMKFVRTGERE